MLATVDDAVRDRTRWLRLYWRRGNERLTDAIGGPARRKAVLILAAVLSLSAADVGAVSALAPQLEDAFRVGNAGIGLLVTASSLVGAIATLPVGVLTDRFSRTRLLSISIMVWGVAEVLSAASTSFVMLMLTRIGLGVVTATAGPAVASLTGDLFPANERSRIYGWILTGELLGTGLGVVLAGDIGAATSWRVGLAILALPSLALAWVIHRRFPEPARGGQSRLIDGAEEIVPAGEAEATGPPQEGDEPGRKEIDPVLEAVDARDIEPEEDRVIAADGDMRLRDAVRWVFRVPTNVTLIVSSSLGYFFLGGLRTFALIYARGRFGLGQGSATLVFGLLGLAAIAGVLVSGRTTDRLLHRGRVDARLVVGGVSFIAAAVLLVPGMAVGVLALALPLFCVASFFLAAPNPPIDAARLDVVPSRMWGRAESIRSTMRIVLEAIAPLLFGVISSALGAGLASGFGAGVNASHGSVSAASTRGLEYTFLIMLVPLVAAGLLVIRARRSYLVDVASAAASERS